MYIYTYGNHTNIQDKNTKAKRLDKELKTRRLCSERFSWMLLETLAEGMKEERLDRRKLNLNSCVGEAAQNV